MEIRHLEAKLFHANGWTVRHEVTVRNFVMRLKILSVYLKRTNSVDCIWICTVQHIVPMVKLTAFS